MSRSAKEDALARGEAVPSWAALSDQEEWALIRAGRISGAVPVRQPLVLISQVPRSGGTLLSRLFDGHPECHAHPHELLIGYPSSREWPRLELDQPDRWFMMLYESKVTRFLRKGHRRPGWWHDHERDAFPFCFSPRLQKAIFDRCTAARQPASERDVLDCYFTSYFNAWLDNHNLYTGPKKVVTGFVPGVQMRATNMEQFFAAYPDGFLITIVRDPCAWYISARKYAAMRKRDDHLSEPRRALAAWRTSAEASLDAAERYGKQVIVLTYEALVRDTELVLARICGRIGLTMAPIMLTPTFNGVPIGANSSERRPGFGVLQERVDAFRSTLDAGTIATIQEVAGDLHTRAEQLAAQ